MIAPPDELVMTPQIAEAAKKIYAPGGGGSASSLGLMGGNSIQGSITDPAGAYVAGAQITVKKIGTTREYAATANGEGQYGVSVPTGIYQVKVERPGFKPTIINGVQVTSSRSTQANLTLQLGTMSETVTITAGDATSLNTEVASIGRAMAEDASIEVNVSTQEIDELFEYKIDQPVSIKRSSSALIPIVQSSIEGETASLYNAKTLKQHPMSAVYLTNTTGLTLEGGPITVMENNTYAGEAMTARIKAGEKRFITYAVDVSCRVETKSEEENQTAYQSEIINGEFRVHYKQSKVTTYTLTNVSAPEDGLYGTPTG